MKRFPPLLGLLLLALSGCQERTAVERANEAGILLVGNSAEPKALDPQLVTGVVESNLIGSMFEGLVADHPSDDAAAPPGAAASWSHNEAMTVWTFQLRPEARWSDGQPVTSEDFAFAYRRILTPDLAAPYAEMLYFLEHAEAFNKDRRGEILFRISPPADGPSWDDLAEVNFQGRASEAYEELTSTSPSWKDLTAAERRLFVDGRGLDRLDRQALQWVADDVAARFGWPEGFDRGAEVIERLLAHADQDLWSLARVGVEALGRHTLQVRLREPLPYLPSLTRHYTWFPIPKHVVLAFGKIGDRFTDWSEYPNLVGNGPFRLKAWRFHDCIEVERNPHYWDAEAVSLNGIRFIPIENPYTEARAFLAEQLHTTYGIPADLIDTVAATQPEFLRQEPYVGTSFIRLNTTRPGFDDAEVRRALSWALDREAICEHIFKGYTPAASLTPDMGAYRPEAVLGFDPDRARALLADAGYPGGQGFPRYSLLISRPSARAPAEAVQAMWRKHLGVLIDIENQDWGSYISAQQDLDFDLALAGWIGDYLDPTTFLNMWTEGNGNNNTGWHDERFEQWLAEAAVEADPAKRFARMAQAERLLMDEQPILPVAWYARNYLHRPEVKGWHPLLLDNHPWKAVYLEP